jgi:DNA-directed RNA polymerase specialized sigma24 family protein
MEEVLRRWTEINHPQAYARRAVMSNLVKDKTRGLDRVRRREAQVVQTAAEGGDDAGLVMWEDQEWVRELLESLPPAQRAVMALVVDGFSADEVAFLLGKSPGAVRQNLCDARVRLKAALQDERLGTGRSCWRPAGRQADER